MGTTARAVEIFQETRELTEKAIRSKVKEDKVKATVANMEKHLRARARNIPSLVLTHGLAPTLAFLCSKADRDFYNHLINSVEFKKLPGGEELSYTVYLAMLVRFLREDLGAISADDWDGLISDVGRLDSQPHLVSTLSGVFYNYVIELKKVIEAAISEEGA